jgi:poly-gamma-glutamate capsule biosynthesis protein CapA/YwtB (metallophosphatase superfamily)
MRSAGKTAAVIGITLIVSTAVSAVAGEQAVAAPSGSTFTVAAGGDVLIHPEVTEQAKEDYGGTINYDKIFAGIMPRIAAADLAICHLEVPLSTPTGPFSGFPKFNAPPQIVDTLKRAGYDACSTASNHSLDQGEDGVRRTLDKLDAVGIKHHGTARSAAEGAQLNLMTVYGPGVPGGVRVANLSYSYGFNNTTVPPDKPWLANRLTSGRVIDDARRAKAAGAEVVVVSLHWGIEYQHDPSDMQLYWADRLAAEPAVDLIVGHHAHVTQPYELVHDTWVAYGLGNQVAKHLHPRGVTEEGVLGWFEFTKSDTAWTVKARYAPTYIDLVNSSIRLKDLRFELAKTTLSATRRERYYAAYTRIRTIVRSRGAGEDGASAVSPSIPGMSVTMAAMLAA